jgi:hypothetical protein
VPPRIAYPDGESGPSGEEAQPRPGVSITRLPFQLEEAEEPVDVTTPQPSARRGMENATPGYRYWRRK